jgi:hypothetical protein
MVGDLDHNGRHDFAIASPFETNGSTYKGVARVRSGINGGLIRAHYGAMAFGNEFGSSMVGPGDLNDDGYSDLLIADQGNHEGGIEAGKVWAHSGRDYPPSRFSYGNGVPGTNGVPELTAEDPILCDPVTLTLGNSRGAVTPAILLVGLAAGDIDTQLGGKIGVAPPWLIVVLTVPAAGASLTATVPCDTEILGLQAYLQALEVDPGAPVGVSFTRGLRLVIGL